MKKLLPFIVVVMAGLLIWGCKKDEQLQPYYSPDYGDLQYTINGVRDTFLEQTGKVSFPLFVERSAGAFEEVSLTVKGMPEGMTARFSPQSSVASFNTNLTLETDQVEVGNYSLQVVGVSQTTGQKYFDFAVAVKPHSNPALSLEGMFKESRACSQTGNNTHDVEITPVDNAVGKIRIKGIWVGGGNYTVTGTINSDDLTVSVPAQLVNGVMIQGSGTYSKDKMDLAYSVKDTSILAVVDDNCTSLFTRQ